MFNRTKNSSQRRFRIYRETLSRFSCAASPDEELKSKAFSHLS
ncbi:hypothetical protein ABLN72_12980 [Mycobacterium tuberculosis]